MKTQSKWLIKLSLIIIVISAWLWIRSDYRLVGTYIPNIDATYPEWNREYGCSRESVSGAFEQMFNARPMSFTKRHMLMSSQRGDINRRYVVLLKDEDSCHIVMYPPILYRIDFTADGIRIVGKRILWYPRYPLQPIEMKSSNHELVGTAHPKRAIRPTALTLA